MLVAFIPLTDTLVVFHELIKPPRLLACQQNVPAPSKVNGIVTVDVTGLHVLPLTGVDVRVAVGPAVGVRVRVAVGPASVGVSEGPPQGVNAGSMKATLLLALLDSAI